MLKRKLPVLLLNLTIALVLASCGLSNNPLPAAAGDPSGSAAGASGSSAPAASAVPVFVGSSMESETLRFEQNGFPKANPQQIGTSFEYVNNKTDEKTGADLSCDIYFTAGGGNSIISGAYTAENTKAASNDDFLKAAEEYLVFCAAIQYDGADDEAVNSWISDSIGKGGLDGISMSAGSAVLTLYDAANGQDLYEAVWLEIYTAD